MFDKKCENCGAPATVQMDLLFYCSKHAFEKVMGTKGRVAEVRSVR
jgi:hypothetical protein